MDSTDIAKQQPNQYLSGQLLVAMPGIPDPCFSESVIYVCAHNSEGAMGLVINRPLESLTFPDLLGQLDIPPAPLDEHILVHFGGPVEAERGFVLHSPEYIKETTMVVNQRVALTATIDILRDIALGIGPRRCLLALGCAGWGPGQLDAEISANGWLHVAADEELLYSQDLDSKWKLAMTKIGIDPRMLAEDAGHA